MSGKTNKSILKRFKITRTGKILRRPSGLNHFNARAASGVMRSKRRRQELSGRDRRAIMSYPRGKRYTDTSRANQLFT